MQERRRFNPREALTSRAATAALAFALGVGVHAVVSSPDTRAPMVQVTPGASDAPRPKDGRYDESNDFGAKWPNSKNNESISGPIVISSRVFRNSPDVTIDRVFFTLDPANLENPVYSDDQKFPEQGAWIIIDGAFYDEATQLWKVPFDTDLYQPKAGKTVRFGIDIYGRKGSRFVVSHSPDGKLTVEIKKP